MGKKGITDKDLGYSKILKSIKDLGINGINVGIPSKDSVDGVSVAQYGYWNEIGVKNKTSGWRIPPRPFLRGWVDSNSEEIKRTFSILAEKISSGKIDADTAIKSLGQYAKDGVKHYIRHGDFIPNSPATIEKKGSSKPLIDTGTLRNSITYEIVKNEGGK